MTEKEDPVEETVEFEPLSSVEPTPEELQPQKPSGPRPADINNPRTTGVHWFEGTPWSTNPSDQHKF